MSEFPHSADEYELSRQPEYHPENYIETFFTSPRGHTEMEDLIHEIDRAIPSNPKGIAGKVSEILKSDNTIGLTATLLINEVGVEGLNSSRFVQAFRDNPAMTVCLRIIERTRYDGADEMATLYGSTLTILANITRYQLFDNSYDPESDEWYDRADHIVYIREGEHTQYLPAHPDNPAYSREY